MISPFLLIQRPYQKLGILGVAKPLNMAFTPLTGHFPKNVWYSKLSPDVSNFGLPFAFAYKLNLNASEVISSDTCAIIEGNFK
jgi:hypothetical protein